MSYRPYQKLIAWQEAHKLCINIYEVTKQFPADERFGLTSQMRRAASSVPINIAEGNVTTSRKEQAHFLEISLASLEELHYECFLAKDLTYISPMAFSETEEAIQHVGFLTARLRKSLL